MSALCNKVGEFVQGEDEIVTPFYEGLHGGEIQQQTVLGGCLSFGVRMYLWYIMITKGAQMFNLDGPSIVSQEVTYGSDDKIKLSETSKHLLEIW